MKKTIFFRFPNLRLLDFRKIKVAHRKEAIDLFKSKRGKELLKEIAKKTKSNLPAFSANDTNSKGKNKKKKLTKYIYQYIYLFLVPGASPADLLKIREAIKKATSLQEVERLTRILQSGSITEDLLNGKSIKPVV